MDWTIYAMSSGEYEYSSSALKKTKWGEFHFRDDNLWETSWRLQLVDEMERETVEIYRDETIGFRATLQSAGGHDAQLTVVTREHAMSAVNYSATFTSFRLVNEQLQIAKIEELPRDWYPPFR